MTAQGQPRTIFRRAVEHGNLILAEGMARELGQITLAEALELVALVAQKDPRQHSRYAVRWLRRLLEEDERVRLEARVRHRDPRRRYSARTVALYRQRLDQHILPELGHRAANELTVADVRRLIDRLAAKR